LLGFALHGAYDHAGLASREGGRPYFEPAVLEAAGVNRGLLFIPSDHGFNLAHQPGAASPLEVVRWRGDGHDRVAWERRGKPPAYVYEWFAGITPAPRVIPYDVSQLDYRFEAENEWPVLAVHAGWARPEASASDCASGGRGLLFTATGAEPSVTLELPVPRAGVWRVHIGSEGDVLAEVFVDGAPLALEPSHAARGLCSERVSTRIALEHGARRVSFRTAPGATTMIDYVALTDSNP
jgi:hypothetical protein